MKKLLTVDLRSSVPGPDARPEMNDFLKKNYLNQGQSEIRRWQPIDVIVKDDRESPPGLTDFIFAFPLRMVSLRFAELLHSFQCECEYLSLIVHYKDQQLKGEYFALNVLHVVRDALDVGQSKIGFYDHEFQLAEDVEKLVLKETALDGAPLSYLREISAFAVSEELAIAIDKVGLIGIKLLKPEEFRS